MQVVGVIGDSASQQDDTHSHQVAAATLGAVVPAWLQAGKPLQDLAAAVVAPLPDLPPHRRYPLLAALIAVVPEVGSSRPYTAAPACCACWLVEMVPGNCLDTSWR